MTGMKVVVRFARDCKSLAGVGAMFALPPPYPIASLMPSGLFPCRLWLTHRFWLQINISPHLSSSGPFCVGFGVIIEGPNLLDLLVPSLPPPGEIGLVPLPDWVFIHFCLSFSLLSQDQKFPSTLSGASLAESEQNTIVSPLLLICCLLQRTSLDYRGPAIGLGPSGCF